MPDARRTRPRLGASAAALGWFLGLYAFPFLHNLDHRGDHSHGPSAAAELTHPHADAHPHPHPHEHAPEAPEGGVPLDSDHGTGSVLHFAAAALEAAAYELPPAGPRIPLPPPPSPRPAPSIPERIVLVRGPPVTDSL